MSTQTIDITPMWREILPALLALLENPTTHEVALEELQRMAGAADRYIALVKRIKVEA